MRPDRWQRWRAGLAWAFAVDRGAETFAPDDLAFLDRIAASIVRRGLAAPAQLFLETLAPLSFLGSQALYAVHPLLDLAGGARDGERLAALLERREAVALLQSCIEAAAAAAGGPPTCLSPGGR
ncbi:MAG TPA: hypothetical protein VIG69_13535 [Candidatus Methylomirabilis sp.]|jgi:hypothetical protein